MRSIPILGRLLGRRSRLAAVGCALAGVCVPPPAIAADDWPATLGDPGGMRYSPLADIDRDNVAGSSRTPSTSSSRRPSRRRS